jgi:predicted O-methyltransferase YrrM
MNEEPFQNAWRIFLDTEKFFRSIQPLVQDRSVPSIFHRALRRLKLAPYPDMYCDVKGMASPKKLKLLNAAVAAMPSAGEECYLEVGTFQGKSLVAALDGNPGVPAVACDTFILFDDPTAPKNLPILKDNLSRYGLADRVQFFNSDFQDVFADWQLRSLPPVGVYFYDGAHDEESQYLGIRLAEDLLADNAVVIVDDWRYAEDSQSLAEAGTKRAIEESKHNWTIRHVLQARFNGDRDLWWNGLAVLTFNRVKASGS